MLLGSLKMSRCAKGQNLSEIVIVFAVVGLVLAGMQVYVRRGIQGRVRDLTDSIIKGKQFTPDDPDSDSKTTSNSRVKSTNNTIVTTRTGGLVDKSVDEGGTLASSSTTITTTTSP